MKKNEFLFPPTTGSYFTSPLLWAPLYTFRHRGRIFRVVRYIGWVMTVPNREMIHDQDNGGLWLVDLASGVDAEIHEKEQPHTCAAYRWFVKNQHLIGCIKRIEHAASMAAALEEE